ncbi:hypothetical protein [Chryseobacterium sp.]|uniref:hypothetical protein n=1 Tax=Chryseobacterium sp. TaxID=1871047 RepID=UPI0031CE5C5C
MKLKKMNFEHCNYTTISPQFRKIKLAATTGQRDEKTSVRVQEGWNLRFWMYHHTTYLYHLSGE